MSHFLARLVDRARGTAARVEPITPSRFASRVSLETAAEIDASAAGQPISAPTTHQPTQVAQRPPSAIDSARSAADPADAPFRALTGAIVPTPEHDRASIAPNSSVATLNDRVTPDTTSALTRPAEESPSVSSRPVVAIARMYRLEHDTLTPSVDSRPAAPVVRVTIGRIDVHAAPAPTPQRRPANRASKPALPLDAYLKSRKDGAR